MTTHFTYLKTSILCLLIGHFFRRIFIDLHCGESAATVETTIEYHQCRFCRTRQATMSGEYRIDRLNFKWLQEYMEQPKPLYMQMLGRAKRVGR